MKILCADVGGTSIKSAMVDEQGKIVDFKEVPTESSLGALGVMENLRKLLATYEGYGAIGISTAGQVDSEKGEIIYASENIPGYTGMKVKKMMEEAFQVPVKVDNDVNCAARGEAKFGAGIGKKDLLCLTFGTGVGGAIYLDHKIYGGKNGVAGEFGHIVLHPEGQECTCGQKGCYEVYASARVLVREAKKLDVHCDNGRKLFERIHQGEEAFCNVLDAWALQVSYGLVNLVHIFNPSMVILGGGILEQELAFAAIQKHTYDGMLTSFREVTLVKAALGNKAGLLGAASLFL